MQSAAKAGELSVRSDHAVARDDNRNRVLTIRHPNSSDRFGVADSLGKLAVRRGRPVRNVTQFFPDELLKTCPFKPNRDVKLMSLPLKVLLELLNQRAKWFVIVDPLGLDRDLSLLLVHTNICELILLESNQKRSKGALDLAVINACHVFCLQCGHKQENLPEGVPRHSILWDEW